LYGDLFRTDDANLRKYLDKSWLEKMFQEYKVKIIEKKWELLNGSLDAEWIASLAQTVNNMLALKKEAVLWAQTIEKDYDENWNIIYRIPWFLTDSVANLVKWAEKLWDWEVWAGTQYIASAW
jgi:ferredoxin-fold anticodon binding domain-containing protein